jgi:hypothetical protein
MRRLARGFGRWWVSEELSWNSALSLAVIVFAVSGMILNDKTLWWATIVAAALASVERAWKLGSP